MDVTKRSGWRRAGLLLCLLGVGSLAIDAQTPSGAPTSSAPAKELAAALQAKKLEAFAVKDSTENGRFIAVLLVPGVQLLVVSAAYDPPSDIEYRIRERDYMAAYQDLNQSIYAKDKVLVEDAFCDGLSAKSVNGVNDSVTIGTKKSVFDGEFSDPKKKPDPKKISHDEYFKAFADADARYTHFLTTLIDGLKKTDKVTPQ